MRVRHTAFFAIAALAAATPALAAEAPRGLCNAAGKVEVLSEPSGIDCGSGAAAELKALNKARARYQDRIGLDWERRGLIRAQIERRIGELRREIGRNQS